MRKILFTLGAVAAPKAALACPVCFGDANSPLTIATNMGIIATMKGSMVASVFMHLSHERKWIYGALILTVIGFAILMTVPLFTIMDHIGTPIHVPAPSAEHAGH